MRIYESGQIVLFFLVLKLFFKREGECRPLRFCRIKFLQFLKMSAGLASVQSLTIEIKSHGYFVNLCHFSHKRHVPHQQIENIQLAVSLSDIKISLISSIFACTARQLFRSVPYGTNERISR